MERIDNLLPDAGKAMSGSSASRKHGQAETLKLDDKICPHCGRELQAEWVEFPPALQKKYDKREWELARRDARVATLRERSGLSKRMKGYALDNFNHGISKSSEKAFAKVMDYIMNWQENREAGRGLYFCGGVGIGKTHLAVAVMNELMARKRVPSLFVTVPEFLDNLREAYMIPGRDLDEWMDTVKNADLLILDDLGSERPTEWVRERLFVIVNHRYREALPTLFTSNIGPKDLASQLGERTASRIIAMCDWISLEGEDFREAVVREGR